MSWISPPLSSSRRLFTLLVLWLAFAYQAQAIQSFESVSSESINSYPRGWNLQPWPVGTLLADGSKNEVAYTLPDSIERGGNASFYFRLTTASGNLQCALIGSLEELRSQVVSFSSIASDPWVGSRLVRTSQGVSTSLDQRLHCIRDTRWHHFRIQYGLQRTSFYLDGKILFRSDSPVGPCKLKWLVSEGTIEFDELDISQAASNTLKNIHDLQNRVGGWFMIPGAGFHVHGQAQATLASSPLNGQTWQSDLLLDPDSTAGLGICNDKGEVLLAWLARRNDKQMDLLLATSSQDSGQVIQQASFPVLGARLHLKIHGDVLSVGLAGRDLRQVSLPDQSARIVLINRQGGTLFQNPSSIIGQGEKRIQLMDKLRPEHILPGDWQRFPSLQSNAKESHGNLTEALERNDKLSSRLGVFYKTEWFAYQWKNTSNTGALVVTQVQNKYHALVLIKGIEVNTKLDVLRSSISKSFDNSWQERSRFSFSQYGYKDSLEVTFTNIFNDGKNIISISLREDLPPLTFELADSKGEALHFSLHSSGDFILDRLKLSSYGKLKKLSFNNLEGMIQRGGSFDQLSLQPGQTMTFDDGLAPSGTLFLEMAAPEGQGGEGFLLIGEGKSKIQAHLQFAEGPKGKAKITINNGPASLDLPLLWNGNSFAFSLQRNHDLLQWKAENGESIWSIQNQLTPFCPLAYMHRQGAFRIQKMTLDSQPSIACDFDVDERLRHNMSLWKSKPPLSAPVPERDLRHPGLLLPAGRKVSFQSLPLGPGLMVIDLELRGEKDGLQLVMQDNDEEMILKLSRSAGGYAFSLWKNGRMQEQGQIVALHPIIILTIDERGGIWKFNQSTTVEYKAPMRQGWKLHFLANPDSTNLRLHRLHLYPNKRVDSK